MNAHYLDRQAWRRKAGIIGLATALLALGGCVTCPDGSVGNVCYPVADGRYGGRYYSPPQAQYGTGYYTPPPPYYSPRYYQRPYYYPY